MTGNDATVYSIANYYDNRLGSFPFLDQPTMYTPNIAFDSNLSPEFTKEVEVGFNVILFNSRVDLDVTYYDRISTDQLISIAIPATSGYTSFYTNAGSLQNKGFEVALGLTPVKTKSGLVWNIFTTFTNNKNTVKELPEDYDRMRLHGAFGDPQAFFEEGQPYGVLRGSVAARDDEGNLLIDKSTGVLITDPEFENIGDPNPDYIVGLNNSVSWKGFGFTFQFTYKKGGDLFSTSLISMLGRGVTKDTEDREHTYILPGVYGDPDTAEPLLDADGNTIENVTQVDMNALVFGNSFAINGISEFGIYDATVLRLSQVGLTYTLPTKFLSKTPFGSLSISLTGNNLWYYAPNVLQYSNFDPELNSYGASNTQGIEWSVAPSVRRFGASLKITF